MSRRPVAHGLAWTAAGFVGSGAVSLGASMALTRRLPPAAFGEVALAMTLVGSALLVIDLGLSPAIVQRPGDVASAATTTFVVQCATGVAVATALALGAGTIAGVFAMPALAPVLRALSLVCVLRAVMLVPRALLQRRFGFRQQSTADMVEALTRAAVAIPLAWRGWGASSLVIGELASQVTELGCTWWLCRWRPERISWRPHVLRDLGRFARPMLGATLAIQARSQVDRIAVGALLGPVQLGYYHLANRLAALPVSGIIHVSNRVMFPVYAAAGDADARRRAYLRTLAMTSQLAFPICAGLIAVAAPLVHVVFGPGWQPVVRPLQALVLASLVSTVSATTGEIFKAVGRPDQVLRTALPHAVLLAVGVWIGGGYGLAGVCVAVVASRAVAGTAAFLLLMQTIALGAGDVWRALAPAVAASVVMLGAVRVVDGLLPGTTAPVMRLAVLVTAGLGAYAPLAWGLSPDVRRLLSGRSLRRARRRRGDVLLASSVRPPESTALADWAPPDTFPEDRRP
jgi:PST family polysaccharide transporter